MRLASLVVATLVALAPGCKQDGAEDGKTLSAGKVVVVEGDVAATRDGGEPRKLAASAEIFRDDVIETSKGASVSIRLNHNNADWQLDEGMRVRVDRSMAWKAPTKANAPLVGKNEKDDSFVAGRHSEKEAGEGQATAVRNYELERAESERADPAPATAPPKAKPSPRNSGARAKRGSGDGAAKNPALQAQPDSIRGASDSVAAPDRGPSDKSAAGSSESAEARPSAKTQIRRAIRACYSGPAKGTVLATIVVSPSGKILSVATKLPRGFESMSGCVSKRLTGEKLIGVKKRITVTVTFK